MTYPNLWKTIFPKHYREKYKHSSGFSGGGGDYPVYDIHLKEDVILKPKYNVSTEEFPKKNYTLASSVEYFNVPKHIVLLTKNKSSIARMGVDASFNTLIDNGFKGYLTIELINHSDVLVTLEAGQPILQVFAQPVMFPCKGYDGKYQNQPDQPVSAILEK